MPDLDAIFRQCLASVDMRQIFKLIEDRKQTGQVLVAGKSEFCGTFGVATDHPAFDNILDMEDGDDILERLKGQPIHIVFLSYEVMGLRGYRLRQGNTASSLVSKIIDCDTKVLSYDAPVSNAIAEVARKLVPHAYAVYEDYFEKKVSFVILTGLNNGAKFAQTVQSFCKNIPISDEIEVIAVVNGSDDDSASSALKHLAARYDLKIVRPKHNIGYGGGMNAGIAAAVGKYVCLIPDDIEFSWQDPFKPIIELLDEDPEVGIVGAYTGGYCFKLDDPESCDGLEYPFWVMLIGSVEGPQTSAAIKDQFVEVDYASALCFVFRRELGRYDPRYYPYGLEEVAFCLEAKKRGYKVFLTDAGLSHDFASSVTRKEWVKSNQINKVHIPYANASYQLLQSYADQLRSPEQYLGVKLYSVAGQFSRPANPPLSFDDMKDKVEVRPWKLRD